MKNSTVLLIFGILGLGGVGVYLYLKNKKAPNNITTPNKDATTSGTPPTSTSGTPPTSTSGTPSVADSSLGLPLPIDKIVSLYNEAQIENYKKAKVLSKDIEVLINRLKTLESDYAKAKSTYLGKSTFISIMDLNRFNYQIISIQREMSEKTSQANALGYKILPYGEIEKM
jgi:hypothetical protein